MIGLCTEVSEGVAVFLMDGEAPSLGNRYLMEDATHGTAAQNRAFHSLLNAFWYWMHRTDNFVFQDGGRFFDLSTPSADDFREFFKKKYGAGAKHYQYVDDAMAMVKVKNIEDIPQYVIDDFQAGNHGRIKAVLRSWSNYTKKQRKEAIDNLVMLIGISQCDDKKVHEILDGMEHKDA